MNEISTVSGTQRLTSQIKVSLESTQKQPQTEATLETKQIEQFEIDMEQINHAFELVRDIRTTLESALHDLSPQ